MDDRTTTRRANHGEAQVGDHALRPRQADSGEGHRRRQLCLQCLQFLSRARDRDLGMQRLAESRTDLDAVDIERLRRAM